MESAFEDGPRAGFFSASNVSERNRTLYQDAPRLARWLYRYRPYICPFEPLTRGLDTPRSAFEVGCGGGILLNNLAAAGLIREGLGRDIFAPAIAHARSAQKRGLDTFGKGFAQLTFERADPHAVLDTGNRRFELVLLVDVLHHVPPPLQVSFLRGALRCADEDGMLVYKDMSSRPVWRAQANRLHDLVLAQQWIHYLPLAQVKAVIAEEGWTIERELRYAKLWYGHELVVARR